MVQSKALDIDVFFRAAFSVDVVLFSFLNDQLHLLLQVSKEPPYQDQPGLPGKLVFPNEDPDRAVREQLLTLTGQDEIYHRQLRAFADPARHPLGRVITLGYYAVISQERVVLPEDATLVWTAVSELPKLSYDHNRIVESALRRLQKGLLRKPLVFELLPAQFTLTEVQRVYESAFEQELDHRNFRRKLIASQYVTPLQQKRAARGQLGKRPQLFSFDREGYKARARRPIAFNF